MQATIDEPVSKAIYHVIASLTKEPRLDVALSLAIKDLIRLKLKEATSATETFEARYRMTFGEFKRTWHEDRVPNAHSYEVERDYWEWEAATTDQEQLQKLQDSLL